MTLKGLLMRRARLVLTMLAVTTGVALMAGTLMLTDSTGRATTRLVVGSRAGVDVVVRNAEVDVQAVTGVAPEALRDRVARVLTPGRAGGDHRRVTGAGADRGVLGRLGGLDALPLSFGAVALVRRRAWTPSRPVETSSRPAPSPAAPLPHRAWRRVRVRESRVASGSFPLRPRPSREGTDGSPLASARACRAAADRGRCWLREVDQRPGAAERVPPTEHDRYRGERSALPWVAGVTSRSSRSPHGDDRLMARHVPAQAVSGGAPPLVCEEVAHA